MRPAMFAIIRLDGRQYRVEEKQVIITEKAPVEAGKTFEIDKVLLVHDKRTVIGQPYVANAKVQLKVLKTGRAKKIRVFKMKAKKRYKRTKGHRQWYSRLEVEKINT